MGYEEPEEPEEVGLVIFRHAGNRLLYGKREHTARKYIAFTPRELRILLAGAYGAGRAAAEPQKGAPDA